MAYRDNISALAGKLGITNNPGLREEDIRIAELLFIGNSGQTVSIHGTDMNRGGRLFIQSMYDDKNDEVVIDKAFLTHAVDFFAELWEPNPELGKRILLDAIRASDKVKIIWK